MAKTLMSEKDKKMIIAGSKANSNKSSSYSKWNNIIGFGIIGQTIVLIAQTIFSIINSFTSRPDDSKKPTYGSSFSKSTIRYRISKYPSNSTMFI